MGTREETVRGESNKRQGENLKMITGESWVEQKKECWCVPSRLEEERKRSFCQN